MTFVSGVASSYLVTMVGKCSTTQQPKAEFAQEMSSGLERSTRQPRQQCETIQIVTNRLLLVQQMCP